MATLERVVCVLLVLGIVECWLCEAGPVFTGTMVSPTEIVLGWANDTGVAWGTYKDSMNETGWGFLDVHSTSQGGKWNDTDQAYAAGFLEGYLCHARISQHMANMKRDLLDEFNATSYPPALTNWFQTNIEYVRGMIKEKWTEDKYWYNVLLVEQQLVGLMDGVNKATGGSVPEMEFLLLQANGDLDDLASIIRPSELRHTWDPEWADLHHHCTGLIKLLPDNSDYFVSQDMWALMSQLNRILKDFQLEFEDDSIVAKEVTFSSYPGLLFSVDDFYQTSAGLTVLETTFNIFNDTLYDLYVSERTVLTWMRVPVANRMSGDGKQWIDSISKINSGTYNNQWIAVDSKKFREGRSPAAGFLWVGELIPGFFSANDRTEQLIKDTYYPSINTPQDEFLFDMAGFPTMVESYGAYWSYYNCSRYNIISRDAPKIDSFESFKTFMMYNNWTLDPLSCGDPAQSIASRYDLRIPGPSTCDKKYNISGPHPFGCLDSKCTSYNLTLRYPMGFAAIGSPTHSKDVAPFYFTEPPFQDVPAYEGLLQTPFEFGWLDYVGTKMYDRCWTVGHDDCDQCTANPGCGWCTDGGGMCLDRQKLNYDCGKWYIDACPSNRASHAWIYILAVCSGVGLAMCVVMMYYVKKTKLNSCKFGSKKTTEATGAQATYEPLADESATPLAD